MTRLALFVGATVGGAVGWWLGALVGTMTAFFLGVVGTALGVWIARRWASSYS